MHAPQSSVPPQPSSTTPHEAPRAWQVARVQPHWWATPPPPQVLGSAQDPQSRTSLQPSETLPHEAPSALQLVGVHGFCPHLFAPAPPQISPGGHAPHDSTPSHPSSALPQSSPSAPQVEGWQPHLFDVPPPPHVCGATQLPQCNVLPQPSSNAPQLAGIDLQVAHVTSVVLASRSASNPERLQANRTIAGKRTRQTVFMPPQWAQDGKTINLLTLLSDLRARLVVLSNSISPSMLARALFVTSVLLSSSWADADEEDPRCQGSHSVFHPLPDACLKVIDTDRPHQTDTPHVMPAGHTQVEMALVSLELGGRIGAPPGARGPLLGFFENSYRMGLQTRVDLQLAMRHATFDLDTSKLQSPGPLNARLKFNVLHEKGARPHITLVPTVFAPFAPAQALRAGGLVFWGWELPARFELEVNTGLLISTKQKPLAAVVLASALTWTVAGEFRVFVDVYATGWDIALGAGALWAITRDVQIDAGTYIGLNGAETVATPFVGLSLRR